MASRPRARQCDECAWFEHNTKTPCLKGHRPRFYMPTARTVMGQQWGYRKVCQDYHPLSAQGQRENGRAA